MALQVSQIILSSTIELKKLQPSKKEVTYMKKEKVRKIMASGKESKQWVYIDKVQNYIALRVYEISLGIEVEIKSIAHGNQF